MRSSFSGFGKKKETGEEEKKENEKEEPIIKKKEEIIIENKEINKVKSQDQIAKHCDQYLWLKAIFGGLLFIGSTVSIYLLFRFKRNFMTNKN